MQLLKNMKMPEKNAGYILVKIRGKRLTFEKHTLLITGCFKGKGNNISINSGYSKLLGVTTLPTLPDVVVELSGRLGNIFEDLIIKAIDDKPTICGIKEFQGEDINMTDEWEKCPYILPTIPAGYSCDAPEAHKCTIKDCPCYVEA